MRICEREQYFFVYSVYLFVFCCFVLLFFLKRSITHPLTYSPHAVSSAQSLFAEAGSCLLPPLSHLHSFRAEAASRSCAVSCVQYFWDEEGCCSLPDLLSHEACVYPNTTAAHCSLVQSKERTRDGLRDREINSEKYRDTSE